MKKSIGFVFAFLFVIALSVNASAQSRINIKTDGIKGGIDFPIGSWSDNNGIGFNVADLTKWNVSNNVRVLGRLELTFFGGKQVTQQYYPGYSYTYNTNPIGIFTAGSGFEFNLGENSGFYTMLDVPSMNVIIGTGTGLKVGFGVGLGYEFTVGEASFGCELRGNLYNAFLTNPGEQSIAAIQVGFEAAY